MKRLFFFALSIFPALAYAEPVPLTMTVEIGRPARAVVIRVEAQTIDASIGSTHASQALPITASEATIERAQIANGQHVAIVRASGGEQRAAAVISISQNRPSIVWSGRTDLHGDPGERSADVLTLEDRTADGFADVVVATRHESASLCGEETLLFPRALDPARGELRPVVLRRFSGDETGVTATLTSPGPTGRPLLAALRFTGASSTAGLGEEVSALASPRALTDGDTSTFWAEGRGGPGAGEFVVARFEAGFPIRAIAITAAARGTAGARLGRPRTLWIAGDRGPRLRVTLPEDALQHAGERYWIVPPAPVSWRCMAVVLDGAYAPAGAREAAVHTGIAEVEVYTELDFGGGIDALVAILVEGREGGDEAARLLTGLGPAGSAALASAWDRLDAAGRRRAVRVFAEHGRAGDEGAIDALARAAEDDAEAVHTSALEALGTLGPRAGEHLARLAAMPPPIGELALRPLLRHEPSIVVPALLTAMSAEGGSERPVLRDALAAALDRGERERFEPWAAEAEVPAVASALLGIAARPGTRALAAGALGSLTARAERFEDRWRLIRAARELESEPAVDAWLAEIAREADEWMLRAAAVEALARRDAPSAVELARAALADDYPRVRIEAIRVLDTADDDDSLVRMAREDSWPMVRATAVSALFNRPAGRDTVRRAIRDRSPRVRTAALEGATRANDRAVVPLVRARLEDDNEWPQVTNAALTYVRDLCVREAGPSVIAVIERGLAPSPWAPDVDVAAVAVELAVILGGATRARAAELLADPTAPASMRAALQRRPARSGCR